VEVERMNTMPSTNEFALGRWSRRLAATCLRSVAGVCSAYAQSASEDRPVGPFSKLVVGNGIDVYLTQDAEEGLRIEVEGFDLADIVSEVDGDTLKLSIPSRIDRPRPEGHEARAYLSFVQLSSIEASGGSDIQGRNDLELDALSIEATGGSDVELAVTAQDLELALSGGSDVELSGETQSLSIAASGGSDVEAEALQAQEATAAVTGGSDASLRVSTSIVVNAGGGSDIDIYGNPAQRTINNDRSSDVTWH
jgi:hypothetical protein